MVCAMLDNSSKLVHDHSAPDGARPSAQILQFPLHARRAGGDPLDPTSDPDDDASEGYNDFAQYEQEGDDGEDQDVGHRMLMNVIALAVIALLVGVGVWVANTMASLQHDQDCVAQGRKNCSPIEIVTPKK